MQQDIKYLSYDINEIKSLDGKTGYFRACPSTQDKDLVNDIVHVSGIEFKRLPTPFLYEHMNDKPIGQINNYEIVGEKLFVEGKFDLINEIKSSLSDRQKHGAYKLAFDKTAQLSIGFVINDSEEIDGVRHIKSLTIVEISLVLNPANPFTYFEEVKNKESTEVKAINEAIKSLHEISKVYYVQATKQELINKTLENIKSCYNNLKKKELKRCLKTLGGDFFVDDVMDKVLPAIGEFYVKAKEKYSEVEKKSDGVDFINQASHQTEDKSSAGVQPVSEAVSGTKSKNIFEEVLNLK